MKQFLMEVCVGQSLAVREIYDRYNVGTPYSEANFKQAIRELEAEGAVALDRSASERQIKDGVVTVGDKRIVTFPP